MALSLSLSRLKKMPSRITGLFFSLCFITSSVLAQDKPNIVLMMADNLGYGDLGVYGGGETRGMPTERIDQLAGEGLRLTQFLVEPSCTPSRAALLTGRYSIRSGLSLVSLEGTVNTLADEEITLAEVLKQAGYETAAYGKWHVGTGKESHPQKQGFDDFYGILNTTDEVAYTTNSRMAHFDMDPDRIPNIYELGRDNELTKVTPYNEQTRRTIDVELADRAVAYIKGKANKGKPFFLYIPWTRPHYPNLPSERFEGASRIGLYGDSIMELDNNTGRVLDEIERQGIKNNTFVIWISDNGPMHSTTWPDSGSAGPFRGETGDPWEGSIRTAGMIVWPGKITPGVSNEMFSIMDFYPTIAKLTGVPVPNDRPVDGIDQSAFILGEQKQSNRDSLITFIGDELVAVRWNQYRFYFSSVEEAGIRNQGGFVANRVPKNSYPDSYNIELDQRETHSITVHAGWTVPYMLKVIKDYKDTLQRFPNPPAPNLVQW